MERDRGRDKERSRRIPRKDNTRTRGRRKTRSDRDISNNAMRRMDEEHGSRNENGRRSNHPMNQEADKERKKDRSSSGKEAEERRERMGKRGRNDTLEKLDLCAKRSSPTRRHRQSLPQREDHGTSWMIQNPGIDHQELLVAIHPVRCLTIRRRVSAVDVPRMQQRSVEIGDLSVNPMWF